MGLLTNEKQKSALAKILLAHDNKLCCLTYLAGLVWFLALAYQPLNAGTYFSENALLPGLVESELPYVFNSATQLNHEIQEVMENNNKSTPQDWVEQKFKDIGLETYRQNFSIIYPFRALSKDNISGENVYSILRARRAASTEALVLSIPMRPLAIEGKPATHSGIALAAALAREFKLKPYWSKDIIFLFTDYDEIGTLAWLDAYHGTESAYIIGESLEARSGPIQAAINLELPAENVHYYNLRLEGLNGQLPNLDLVNLVARLCRRERAAVALHHKMPKKRVQYSESGERWADLKLSLSTMFTMMWHQGSGAPSGNHGMFHKFHIEALTLHGVLKKKGPHNGLDTSARIIEGVFRSLNNLLERFHQSFFFYLLPSTGRYVSIGMYMPAFGLMVAACVIKGLSLWLTSSELREEQEKERKEEEKKEHEKAVKIEKMTDEEKTEKVAEEILRKMKEEQDKEEDMFDDTDPTNPANQGFVSITPVILISMLLGWMAHTGPEFLMRMMPKFRITTEDMVVYSYLAIFTAALMYPKLMTSWYSILGPLIRKSSHPNSLLLDWRLLKSIALLAQALVLACVALLNISQAFFLAAALVPITTFVRPTANRLLRWIEMILLVIVSPFFLLFLAGLVSAWSQRWTQTPTLKLLAEGYSNAKQLAHLGLVDAYLFNAWTEAILTAAVFPLWLLFWSVPWADPSL